MLNASIIIVTVFTAALLFYPRLANAHLWRAAITPLASIIGSGFLVLGPILNASYGKYAPLMMALLCLGAYLFGAAIRFNIRRLETQGDARTASEERLETTSSWALAFAYMVSVAYYLNLLGAFAVRMTELNDPFHAKLITSGVFFLILFVGWTRGFNALERMEQVSVGVKLSIIAGLIFGLAWFFAEKTSAGALVFNTPQLTGWAAVTLGFGLIVTVQGFETSRYLGDTYNAEMRVRSMQIAQWVSTIIYMIYIGLLAFVFKPGTIKLDEAAIIDLMAIVAPILPVLLIAAALAAQFSAAVADTGGSGGLLAELTHGRIKPQLGYGILVTVGLTLTWAANTFEIISYASRAFAFYYMLQALIAAIGVWQSGKKQHLAVAYAALSVLGAAIVVFGTSVE